MSTSITISGGPTAAQVQQMINNAGVGSGTPNTEPTVTGMWNDNGVPTWYDAATGTSEPMDLNQGQQFSLFGTPLGDI